MSEKGVPLQELISLARSKIRYEIENNNPQWYPFSARRNKSSTTIVPSQRYISLATRTIIAEIFQLIGKEMALDDDQLIDDDIDDILKTAAREKQKPTTVNQLIDARRGQGKFRADLDTAWQDCCAVSGCSIRALLRASHIKPWQKSTDKERLNQENGLLLCVHLDALFGAYLISFEDDGRILISRAVSSQDRQLLQLDGSCLRKQPSMAMRKYLTFHRRQAGLD